MTFSPSSYNLGASLVSLGLLWWHGIIAAIIDSVIFGRQLSKKVKAKFPNGDNSGQSIKGSALGFYAFNRACLIRKWRVPRPRVDAGAKID